MSTEKDLLLQNKLKNSLQIIRTYDWLIDSYVLDFYIDNHWNRLPDAWKKIFEEIKIENLTELLNNDSNHNNNIIWPLSLLALRQAITNLSICRKVKGNYKNVTPQFALNIIEHPKLKYVFTKCIKTKKRHEIEQMANICYRSAIKTGVDFVIDFGAGLGHLARVLGYGYGISVCCLEMQTELNAQASHIDSKLETLIQKYLTPVQFAALQRPKHVNLHLTADIKPFEFIDTISKTMNYSHKNFSFGIIGLHPCGDLCAILMRLFLNCSQAKFLNFVGCCYMKLTTKNAIKPNTTQNALVGYPLSQFLQLHDNNELSYEAREIACHAIETYNERLLTGNYEFLKVHSYRAAAERIIVKNWPHLKHSGLKSVKHTDNLKFEDYFYKAVGNLSAASDLPLTDLQTSTTQSDLCHWKRIVIFYTLRLMLAPLVESVILYDRILYLLENECHVAINAIFDPQLSPRNHITSASKS